MIFDLDSWQELLTTLRTNKLRAALTAVGVFWGIFMLILMLGAGSGLEYGVNQNMFSLAKNSAFFWGRRTTLPHRGLTPGRRVRFVNADVAAIRARVPDVAHIAPRNSLGGWRGGAVVSRGEEAGTFTVMGDMPALYHIQPMRITAGRFINDFDIRDRRKVAVIGQEVVARLFPTGTSPIGDYIQVMGIAFQVVGTFAPEASGDNADRQAQTIFLPLSTFQQAFAMGDRVGWMAIAAAPGASAIEVEEEVRAVLSSQHQIAPGDRQAIGSYNAHAEYNKIQNLFFGIRTIIWIVGVMTLLAGIIGVVNIMLISVKERTREIGVRKALGATPMAIVRMIMQEAILLTSLAGCLGILAGVLLVETAAQIDFQSDMFANPSVNFQVTLIATSVLIAAGALAGLIPAWHAARIDPVHALRAE